MLTMLEQETGSTVGRNDLLVTFAVPCYNVEGYIDHCVEAILAGTREYHDRIEIILVDDGSTKDTTPERIDFWQQEYPQIIKAIHQPNGGHGDAVNTGLRNASGYYFKVVDADDWLDEQATIKVMKCIATFVDGESIDATATTAADATAAAAAATIAAESADTLCAKKPAEPVDLIITNYVYEKVFEGKRTPIRYKGVLPENRVVGWDVIGGFKPHQYILMHSAMYRTAVLRASGLVLPKHTFYVDNIFVYVPLPSVKTLYYLNVDLYHYFIGREGQSVNEKTMASRIDQQLRITRIMIDAFDLDAEVESLPLRAYMTNYLMIMMTISSVFLELSGRKDAEEQRGIIWAYLEAHNPGVYKRIRHGLFGWGTNLKGRFGHIVIIATYRLAQKLFNFN